MSEKEKNKKKTEEKEEKKPVSPEAEKETVEKAETAAHTGEQKDEAPNSSEKPGKLEQEIIDLKDQLMRRQADFENSRKRLFREKDEAVKYANQMLLFDLVSVIDDFERAIKSSEASRDFDTFHKGIEMIEKQMTSMLEKKWGLARFESAGEVFDPERHQAIAMEESDKYDSPIIIEDYQKGYLYHERVLRPAKVKVAQPKTAGEQKEKTEKDNN